MSNIQPYIILNGTDSRSISGLLISSLPPISKPQVRTQIETVDGRDGDIVTPLGFSAYDKVINIGLTYNYDVDEIIEFFNSEGIVTFSNEPDKYYRYAIYEQIDFEKLIRFKTAEVVLHVQPFKFSTTEEPELFDVVSGQAIAVTNEGNTDSRPNLTIIGSGDIDVSLNGSQILSIELEDDQAVIIDSEDMNAYAAQSAIREVEADIEPIQDLNGYSSVWIGGAGKNKINVANQTLTTADYLFNNYAVNLPAGDWTLSFNTTATNNQVAFTAKNGGTDIASNTVSLISGRVSVTINAPQAITSIRAFSSGIGNFSNFMLENNSTATSFEPYENICEISGSTELNVTLCGKNLFSYDLPIRNGYWGSSSFVGDNSIVDKSSATGWQYIRVYVEGLTTITLSGFDSQGGTNCAWLSSDNPNDIIGVFNSSNKNGTKTIPSGAKYLGLVIFSIKTNSTTYPNAQLEIGSPSSDYESYQGVTNTISFEQDGDPLTVYGGVADITGGKVVSKMQMLDIANANIIKNNTNPNDYMYYTTLGTTFDKNGHGICSHLQEKSGAPTGSTQGFSLSPQFNVVYINVGVLAQNDVEGFKAFCADNNVQLLLDLLTPTEIQLTPTQIYNLLGVNNMYSDTGDITVKHKSNGVIVTDTGAIVSFNAGLDDIEKGVLLNRAITGDYDKIRLRKGVNTFVLTGNAQQFAIDKFSRWL